MDYLDNAPEAQWVKATPTMEFDAWDQWTWNFSSVPF